MKTRLTLATLIASGSIAMIFAAAKSDKNCEEAYKKCTVTCQGELSKCKLSGRPDETCEKEHQICMKKCENGKADCQGGSKKS